MGRIDRGDSSPMSNEGQQVKARRERLGMSIQELAKEAGVSRDTLSDLESGTKDFRRLTLNKIQRALDSIEEEAGVGAPPPAESSAKEPDLIEFDISGDFGVHVIVKGPVADAELLQRQVLGIIREIRRAEKDNDAPEGQ